jgi:AcrR family transcriptional regulator
LSIAADKLVDKGVTGHADGKAMPPRAKPRRRLDAEAARALILDAAEKRLVTVGPSGIRLQEVAADAGVSHPTVLHHFGSRELLVKAVVTRSMHAINASIIEAMQASSGDDAKIEAMIENVAAALEKTGHGRVILWLTLEGQRFEGTGVQLSDVVDATHALRLAHKTKGSPRPTRDDTARTVVLAALALVGGSVLAPVLLENAGLGKGAGAGTQFRKWLTRLLIDHLER